MRSHIHLSTKVRPAFMELDMKVDTYRINAWCNETEVVLEALWNLSRTYIFQDTSTKELELNEWLLTWLSISCEMTSESVLLLVKHQAVWDAEILIRSITEGTLKLAFLCVGGKTEVEQKAIEYWDILPELSRLKIHKNVSGFFNLIGDKSNDPEWRPAKDLLLRAKDRLAIENTYPKQVAQRIKQRWSFSQILQALGGEGLESFLALAYGYAMSSHHVHKDGDSTGLIWDRESREEPRKSTLILAHA